MNNYLVMNAKKKAFFTLTTNNVMQSVANKKDLWRRGGGVAESIWLGENQFEWAKLS